MNACVTGLEVTNHKQQAVQSFKATQTQHLLHLYTNRPSKIYRCKHNRLGHLLLRFCLVNKVKFFSALIVKVIGALGHDSAL